MQPEPDMLDLQITKKWPNDKQWTKNSPYDADHTVIESHTTVLLSMMVGILRHFQHD